MFEIFQKNRIVILRLLGALMLLIGFVIHFWLTPKEGYTQMDVAAANVARMEASVSGNGATKKASQSSSAPFLEEFKNTQQKQMEYLTIIAMILGAGFLLYSFIKK